MREMKVANSKQNSIDPAAAAGNSFLEARIDEATLARLMAVSVPADRVVGRVLFDHERRTAVYAEAFNLPPGPQRVIDVTRAKNRVKITRKRHIGDKPKDQV